MIIRQASVSDIDGILALQERNHISQLNEQQRLQGFVTTRLTPAHLQTLIAQDGLFVALDDNKVAAYMVAASWQFCVEWPIFVHMTERLPSLSFAERVLSAHDTFQYGPVCVDASYRGGSILLDLFEKMRMTTTRRYPIGVTFINCLNERSYQAHTRKLGLQVIDRFEFNCQNYYTLVFDTNRRVGSDA